MGSLAAEEQNLCRVTAGLHTAAPPAGGWDLLLFYGWPDAMEME